MQEIIEQVKEFVKPELLALPFVLLALGFAFKRAERVKDKDIPLFIVAAGVALAALWVAATSAFAGWQSVLMGLFVAIVQGALCGLMAIGLHQTVWQQIKAKKEGGG